MPIQQQWITKLLSYDFIVENRVADALSRKEKHEEGTLILITFPNVGWVDELKGACEANEHLKAMLQSYLKGRFCSSYTTREGLLSRVDSTSKTTRSLKTS